MARTRSPKTVAAPETALPSAPADDGAYRVVARRYRPQTFEEVVGQDHVVQTLRNAIKLGRVTHAYLFSGTRGVGKTSIARIFAKCLNCEHGPTVTPCNTCDICQAISVGQDIDVIEIDGASNNGVEQVRELRQNASLRPSRARYKIYYIDEVHMLSKGAFDALLKTLEEPPEHVKFFFATTEPGKIPDTVRSRCQRFDFAGISPEQIADTLESICQREGVPADREALLTIARRAAGSMRDAQSMLEQALSGEGRHITDQLVHEVMGLAPDERIIELLEAIAGGDAAQALRLFDQAVCSGVQPGDCLNALLEFARDVMVLAAGGDAKLLGSAPSARERLQGIARQWPLETTMAALQILAEARGRMRGSPHGRLLVELALCRCARLGELVEIEELINRLNATGDGTAAAPAKKKLDSPAGPPASNGRAALPPSNGATPPGNVPAAPVAQAPAADFRTRPLTLETFREAWPVLRERMPGRLGDHLAKVQPHGIPEPATLAVSPVGPYNYVIDALEKPDALAAIEQVFREVFGRSVSLRFERSAAPEVDRSEPSRPSRIVRHEDLDADPLVQDMIKLFDARAVQLQLDDEAGSV